MQINNNTNFETNSFESMIKIQRMLKFNNAFCEKKSFFIDRDKLYSFFPNSVVTERNERIGHLFYEEENVLIDYHNTRTSVEVEIYAESREKAKSYMDRIVAEEVVSQIRWMYSEEGMYSTIPVSNDKAPLPSFYPFLSKPLYQYYDDFIKSKQSILILIGQPGTGKSSFVRGLMQYSKKNALVSYDERVLNKDYIFSDFLEGSDSFFIMEDSDLLLKPRKDGNNIVTKFLNTSDGVFVVPDKKMIFTTNLPSIKEIDEAMTRPGRCYDIIDFRPLTKDEANKVRSDVGIEEKDSGGTLAEILNNKNNKRVVRQMGFI